MSENPDFQDRNVGMRPLQDPLVGGQNRVDLSFCVFPCFAVFGGPKISRDWEKQHKKCHCHTPFCVPQMLVKNRTWEQCPHMLAGKARGKWQIDPILPIQDAPFTRVVFCIPWCVWSSEKARFFRHGLTSYGDGCRDPLGQAKTYKMGLFLEIRANPDNSNRNRNGSRESKVPPFLGITPVL